MKNYFIYILASKRNGTLYIGVTSNLIKRVFLHKEKKVDGFTKRYNIDKLVYYELFENCNDAIEREKQLKEWRRSWKLKLIEDKNKDWMDLYYKLI